MRPPGRSSAAAALWPAAASGSNSRWPRAPCVGARRTCVPPQKCWLARTRIRGVAPRTNPPSLFSCTPHLQPTMTGRQGRSCANNRWAIPEHQSGPLNNIEAKGAWDSSRGIVLHVRNVVSYFRSFSDSILLCLRWLRHRGYRKRTGPFGARLVSVGVMRVGTQSLVDDAGMSAGDIGSARTGDESAFRELVEPYRRQLHLHCYRLLGS